MENEMKRHSRSSALAVYLDFGIGKDEFIRKTEASTEISACSKSPIENLDDFLLADAIEKIKTREKVLKDFKEEERRSLRSLVLSHYFVKKEVKRNSAVQKGGKLNKCKNDKKKAIDKVKSKTSKKGSNKMPARKRSKEEMFRKSMEVGSGQLLGLSEGNERKGVRRSMIDLIGIMKICN